MALVDLRIRYSPGQRRYFVALEGRRESPYFQDKEQATEWARVKRDEIDNARRGYRAVITNAFGKPIDDLSSYRFSL